MQLRIVGVAKQLRFDAAARWPPSWPAVAGEMLPSEPSRSFSRHTVQRHWSTFISTALRSKALRARIAGGYSARSKCAPATKQPRTPAVTTNAVQRFMHVLLVDLRRVGVRSHIDAAACYCQPNTHSVLSGDCTGLTGPVFCLSLHCVHLGNGTYCQHKHSKPCLTSVVVHCSDYTGQGCCHMYFMTPSCSDSLSHITAVQSSAPPLRTK